ncbi:MAG: hypothetical protein V1779_16190 [bacterium]
MKTKILILFAVIVGTYCNVSLQAQEPLPDIVWNKYIDNAKVVKFSPDGQNVFIGVRNDILQLDATTGEIVRTMYYHKARIKNICFSSTGDTIISSGDDGRIVLWDYKTGDTIEYISVLRDINIGAESDASFTPDGKRIITLTGLIGIDKPQILIINIETKEVIKTFIGTYSQTDNLAISSDGKYFSFWDFRGTKGILFLMDMNTYKEIARIEYPDDGLYDNAFSWDSRILAAMTDRNGIFLWDIATLKLIKNFRFNNILDLRNGMRRVSFSRDSKNIIFGYYDYDDYDPNKLIVWNIEKDTLVYEYSCSGTKSIDISKDDDIITAGFVFMEGDYVYLLRPNWKVTKVEDNFTNNLKYSYNNSILKIFFDEELFEKPKINIYNILGVGANGRSPVQHYLSPLQNGNEIEIDLEYLTSGVYFVVVDFAGKRSVVKILKD